MSRSALAIPVKSWFSVYSEKSHGKAVNTHRPLQAPWPWRERNESDLSSVTDGRRTDWRQAAYNHADDMESMHSDRLNATARAERGETKWESDWRGGARQENVNNVGVRQAAIACTTTITTTTSAGQCQRASSTPGVILNERGAGRGRPTTSGYQRCPVTALCNWSSPPALLLYAPSVAVLAVIYRFI